MTTADAGFSIVLRSGDPEDRRRFAEAAAGRAEVLLVRDFAAGLESAANEVVLFLAAGARPLPGWFEAFEAAFSDPDLAAAAGRTFPSLPPTASDWARVVQGENLGPFGRFDLGHFARRILPAERSFAPAENFAVRRCSALLRGGFGGRLPLLRRLLLAGDAVAYAPDATILRPIPAGFPLEERFAEWWQEHGRLIARSEEQATGFLGRRLQAWRAGRKSRRYRRRMADWPERGPEWTRLVAKCHLHRGRALELKLAPPPGSQS
ncbi:MAG: hypothetical protein D6702_03110 [Planctomycetota bacterium]|nr:MAG: hypothetical protein D6702_03110 [Planctomycetota bacterium]